MIFDFDDFEIDWERAEKYFMMAVEALNWSIILQSYQQTSLAWRDPLTKETRIPTKSDLQKELFDIFSEMKEHDLEEYQIGQWVIQIVSDIDWGPEIEIFFTSTSSYIMDYEGTEKEMQKWIKNHAIKEISIKDLKIALQHCEESENYELAKKIQKEIKRREKMEIKE
jgi:hypothetical protein